MICKHNIRLASLTATILLILFCSNTSGQQRMIADTTAIPRISNPKYSSNEGPVICIDSAHNNLHTIFQGYVAFSKLLMNDGYQVRSNTKLFEGEISKECNILVIANALNIKNTEGRWHLPTPSAFSEFEIQTITDWVSEGGRLFFIADHMPFPGASDNLASSFGIQFNNGFALNTEQSWPPSMFQKANGTLEDNELTIGIDSIASFTGQAFQIPENAKSIITFNKQHQLLLPDTAWAFNENTLKKEIKGLSQGAYMEYGKGRLVVFGEAAMFSARKVIPDDFKVGFNNSHAHQNARLLLNIFHWLDDY